MAVSASWLKINMASITKDVIAAPSYILSYLSTVTKKNDGSWTYTNQNSTDHGINIGTDVTKL